MSTPTLAERMSRGMDHDPRSVDLFKFIEKLDFEQCSDSFGFKSGGDGDNGEILMFLMDCYFAQRDLPRLTDDELIMAQQSLNEAKRAGQRIRSSALEKLIAFYKRSTAPDPSDGDPQWRETWEVGKP